MLGFLSQDALFLNPYTGAVYRDNAACARFDVHRSGKGEKMGMWPKEWAK